MDAAKVLRLALSVLSERLLVILAMSMTFGLACWSMWGPSVERVVTLAIFCVLAYLLTRPRKEKQREDDQATQ
jgi:hypothetical protein